MQHDPKLDATQCAGKPNSRNHINGVSIVDVRNRRYLASTNGRILSMLDVEIDDDDADCIGKVYPVDAFKRAKKLATANYPVRLTLNGKATAIDGTSWEPMDSRFPDVESVTEPRAIIHRVCLDPTALLALARAIGAKEGVTLEIHDADGGKGEPASPITVRPAFDVTSESFGAIMPIASSN